MCPNDEQPWLREYLSGEFKALDSRLDRTDEKIGDLNDKVSELKSESEKQHDDHSARLDKVETVLTRLTDTVEVHEKRSTMLEAAVKPLLDEHSLEAKLKEHKMARWKTVGMVLGILAAAAELIRSIWN